MTHTETIVASRAGDIGFIHRVYSWMCAGLALTAVTAYVVSSSPALVGVFVGNPIVFLVLAVIEIGLVFYLARRVGKMTPTQAAVTFLAYAFLNGLTFSAIFLAYDMASIGNAFLVSAGTFGVMAAYGYFTKKDLTTIGHLALMALIGLIIAMVVNMFFASQQANIVISFLGVLIFVGLTAHDTQKIRKLNEMMGRDEATERKEAIIGALTLYLDLINLFIFILNLTARRRN
ncbi:MAG: Bax inhibitor-1/YccA family protein [Patescibacteria group bacterium]|nr:Bax inhibitor-1/YccA family protein [Patescibacteria group bacterium]MDE2116558.1 Bax inhibitor-1/YccA family protein [Patescibacteria group bacterium]